MSALQVDPLAGGVGRDQNQDLLIVDESFLDLPPLVTRHPPVNRHDRVLPAQQRTKLAGKVIEGVAVLTEHDQLPPVTFAVIHLGSALEDL